MWANKPARPRVRASGVAAVEFALLAIVFFTFTFGIIEVARLMFVFGTLQEVTRKAAATAVHVYPSDTEGIARLKRNAIFKSGPGQLMLAAPVSDDSIRIDYLALVRAPGNGALTLAAIDRTTLPATPAQHRQVCMRNPNAANCVRFVQVSICRSQTSNDCGAVQSQLMLPIVGITVPFHKATTIAVAESFGYLPGMAPAP